MACSEAVIYCRISPGDRGGNGGNGVKVENQESDGRKLAASLRKPVREVYVDKDISAAQRKKPRKAYLRMLADLQRNPADVIAWHADRLHRQPAELEHYIDIVEPAQITTYTVQASPIDLATASGRLVARMLGNAASYEVEQMRDRQRARKAHDASQGRPLGGRRAFGYTADGMDLCHGQLVMLAPEAERRGLAPVRVVETRRGERVLVVLPYDEAAELQAAARRGVAGSTLHAIAKDWNKRGVRTASGRWWTSHEVGRVLAKPRNAGLMEHRGQIVGPAAWPAAIDELTWRRLRAIFADPARVSTSGPERRWLGSGIYICDVCDETMLASSTTRPRKRVIYRCSSLRRKPGAKADKRQHPARDAVALDAWVEEHVEQWLGIPENMARLTRPAPDLGDIETELERVRGKLDELAEEAGREEITPRQLAIASKPWREREKALEARQEAGGRPDVTGGLDLTGAALWKALAGDLGRQRALLAMILDVRVLPAPNGRPPGWRPGQPYFHPDYVKITPREL
jgi:DNA invertase Pin-like site-specific DNA recombinase